MQGQGYVVPREKKQVKANQVQDKNRQQDGSRYKQSLVSAPTNIFHLLLEYTTLNVAFFINVTIYRALL